MPNKQEQQSFKLPYSSKQKNHKEVDSQESRASKTSNTVVRPILKELMERKKQEDLKIVAGILSRIKHLL